MAQISYTIPLGVDLQLQVADVLSREVFPLLHQAVRAVAKQTALDWQTAVFGAKLWSGEKDAYVDSISWRETGDFSCVVEATYDQASQIEDGRPARDLKAMLNTSHKVRRTTDGRRFLVIPFRHNTPGNGAHAPAMPPAVHAMAQAMKKSKITAMSERLSGEVTTLSPKTGMHAAGHQSPFASNAATQSPLMTAKRTYSWGDRMKASHMKQAGMSAADRKRYAGMVRMDTSTPGGSKSSAYMTFRIMMEGSPKWIVPPRPGLKIAQGVAQAMQPKAEAAFMQAIGMTIKG